MVGSRDVAGVQVDAAAAVFDYVGTEAEFPGVEWFFGNVYDEDGVTPLEWWLD